VTSAFYSDLLVVGGSIVGILVTLAAVYWSMSRENTNDFD